MACLEDLGLVEQKDEETYTLVGCMEDAEFEKQVKKYYQKTIVNINKKRNKRELDNAMSSYKSVLEDFRDKRADTRWD